MEEKKTLPKMKAIDLLLKESWQIFATSWIKFLLFTLATIGLSILLIVLYIIPIVIYAVTQNWSEFNWDTVTAETIVPVVIYLGIGLIVAIIAATVYDLAMARLVYGLAQKEEISIKAAYRYGLGHFFSYLWINLLVFFIVLAGLVLLIVPGFMAIIVLSLVTPIFVLESKKGLAALKRSRELVKGYFWPVAGRLGIMLLLSMIVSLLQNALPTTEILAPVSVVVQFVITFYGIVYLFLVYCDLMGLEKAETKIN